MRNYKNQIIGGAFLLIAAIVGINECQAQDKAVIENDTLKYKGHHFYLGQQITLNIGSGANKDFVFVLYGSGFTAAGAVPSGFNNWEAKIEKVKKGAGGKNYIKAKLIGMPKIAVSTIVIDVVGAIDSNELKFE